MKKIFVFYDSHTGFTERYAHWIGEEVGASVIPLKQYRPSMEKDCDIILCGGGIFGSELSGIRKYRRIQKRNPEKEFIFFATGLRPPSDQTTKALIRYNFEDISFPDFYYFHGGLKLDALHRAKKAMLMAFRMMMRRQEVLSEEDKELLRNIAVSSDYCEKIQILPLLNRLNKEGDIHKKIVRNLEELEE